MQHACRFRRLAGGEDRLSLATLHEQPDLAGNAFVHRIFRLFDTDQDGYLTWEDFSDGIHQICALSSEDDQSLCEQSLSLPPLHLTAKRPHQAVCHQPCSMHLVIMSSAQERTLQPFPCQLPHDCIKKTPAQASRGTLYEHLIRDWPAVTMDHASIFDATCIKPASCSPACQSMQKHWFSLG